MIAASGAFVINRFWAGVAAAGAIAVVSLLAHLLIVTVYPREAGDAIKKRRRGVKALVIGADGRASTSKLQALLWTFAVLFAFTFLLVWGRSAGCDDGEGTRCQKAAADRAALARTVDGPLQAEYYVLLGFPLAAAVAAKALVTNKVAAGTLTKSSIEDEPDPKRSGGVVQGLAEVVSNDRGESDLLDFQYFAFNLFTLAFFFFEFLTKPADGLPNLPATLVALAGLSAATYTTKKALETDVLPAITAVVPRRVPRIAGRTLTVVGTGFGKPPAPDANDSEDPRCVLLDGAPLRVQTWRDNRVVAEITGEALELLPPATESPLAAEVEVMDAQGQASEPVTVEVYQPGSQQAAAG